MKRVINLFLVIISLFVLSSCVEEELGNNNGENMGNIINIYTLNDFHGAIFENTSAREIGISKIGDFLIKEKTKKPKNTIILSAGDMFQGTAVSSMTKGKVVVDLMNTIGFDAMTLGNHEFDWGVSEIERYVDGKEDNGEAKFPFLGANIYHIPTEDYVDWAEPYTIIERGNFKIGIIGLMGEALTSSIIGSVSKDYKFTSQLNAIKKYVPILRNEKGADIVIVVSHDDTQKLNYEIKNLEGNYYVDAVVNGHTHNYYAFEEARENNPPMVVVQSGNNGKYIGHLSLEVDLETKEVINASAGFVSSSDLKDESLEIGKVILNYQSYIDIENEILGYAGSGINQQNGTVWAVNTIGKFDGSDIGIINAGGIRSSGFPVDNGSEVTYGTVFKMMPFENQVITLHLTGSQLRQLNANPGDIRYSRNFDTLGWTIDGLDVEDNKLYKVAVVDYVYYRSEYFFSKGTDIVHHDQLFRDLLVESVKEIVETIGKWDL